MDVMLVVDMQTGLLRGKPKHDLANVVARINALTEMVRDCSGKVIWIQHCGPEGDDFEPETTGWFFLPELVRQPADLVNQKTLNDPFAGTTLQAAMQELRPDRVLVAGWATDFCVDATVRSSVSRNFPVVVASDAHTLSDRPHLAAPEVIRHHNWVWSELIAPRSIRIATTATLLEECASPQGTR